MKLEIEGLGVVEINMSESEWANLSETQKDMAVSELVASRSVAPDEPQGDGYNTLSTAARTLGQGVSFGWGDELEAGVRSQFSDRSYEDIRDELRGDLKEFSRDNPGTALALEIGGGFLVPGAGVASGVLKGAKTIGGRMARSAALGTASGATSGLGSSDADSVSDMAIDTGIGAGLGFGLGGVIPGAAELAGRGVRRVGNSLGIGAENFADRKMLRALQQGGMTPEQAARELQAARSQGVEDYMLADTSKQARDLSYSAQAVPNPNQENVAEKLAERYDTQAASISNKVSDTLGTKADTALNYIDELAESQSIMARAAYPEAYKKQLSAVPFRKFVESDFFRKAYEQARVIQDARNIMDPTSIKVPPIDAINNAQFIPTELLHTIKRGMDEVVESGRDSITKKLDGKSEAFNRVRVGFNDLIKEMNPDYARANAQFADFMTLRAANEMGEAYLRTPIKDLSRMMMGWKGSKSAGELEAFRAGLVNRIMDRAATMSDGADFTKEVFGSPRKRDILKLAFPSGNDFDQFVTFIKRQKSMVRTNRAISGGSQTAPREVSQAAAGIDPGMILDVATSPGVGSATRTMLPRLMGRASGLSEMSADRILQGMTETDPRKQMEVLKRLQALGNKPPSRALNPDLYSTSAGNIGGLLSGYDQ